VYPGFKSGLGDLLVLTKDDLKYKAFFAGVHVEMRSKRELWVKPSLNSMKEEEEGMLAKG
jgi:hypothetical protein